MGKREFRMEIWGKASVSMHLLQQEGWAGIKRELSLKF
jgi:hypothetical protein